MCESLRLQNRFQTANLLFGAPRFRVGLFICFPSKYSDPPCKNLVFDNVFSSFLVGIVDLFYFSFSPMTFDVALRYLKLDRVAIDRLSVDLAASWLRLQYFGCPERDGSFCARKKKYTRCPENVKNVLANV